MTKLALCVGINDYPGTGADLRGCVNDATDWADHLNAHGYNCQVYLDSWATKANVVAALEDLVARARFGDRIAFTYSGHGTWLPDNDGDEIDGRDEALVLHDYASGGFLSDDELHSIFSKTRFGVRVLVVSDSCHSGTMQRFLPPDPLELDEHRAVRFLSPAILPQIPVSTNEAVEAERVAPRSKSRVFGGITLLSGCADGEFSYDANFGGRPRGAFTQAALETLPLSSNLAKWHHNIRQLLPNSRYPQTPQLQVAKRHQRMWRV